MYYDNYNPFFPNSRRYMYNTRSIPQNEIEKKDIESPDNDTISFQDFFENNQTTNNATDSNASVKDERNEQPTKGIFSLFGISFELDDLIIIGIIILMLLESENNHIIIFLLGIVLLNVNLSDIINLF